MNSSSVGASVGNNAEREGTVLVRYEGSTKQIHLHSADRLTWIYGRINGGK